MIVVVLLTLAGLVLAGCGDDDGGSDDEAGGSTPAEEDDDQDESERSDESDDDSDGEDADGTEDEDAEEDSEAEDEADDADEEADDGANGKPGGGTDDVTWDTVASEYADRGPAEITVVCPPKGEAGSVWGTGTYTDDSSICTAAVHAGLITLDRGGAVTFVLTPGQEAYEGTEANGITSLQYGSWVGSFAFTDQA
jgi:hypothetical protein